MTSLRRQLTVRLLGSVAIALAVAGLILHFTVAEALSAQFDRGLAAKARGIGALLESDGEGIEFSYAPGAMPAFDGGAEPEYFALWFQDGTLATRSPSLGDADLPRRFGPADQPEFWDLPLPDGRAGRAIGLEVPAYAKDAPEPVPVEQLPRMTIVVARSRAELEAGLAALATGLLVAAAAALLLVWWSVTRGVRRGLQPLHRLNRQVEEMDAASLSRRVPTEGVPDELLPSVTRLNELFARLQAAFAKEQRMTAAVAHELRTPIAELRTASDVARRWPEDAELAAHLAATAEDVAARMGDAIEALMRYCRLEAGQAEAQRETLPLRALLDAQWEPWARLAGERGVRFANDVADETAVDSDRGLLAILVGNLLGNAASFAAPGAIRAQAGTSGSIVTLRLANDTDQLEAADLAHLSEPFWRKDAARSDGRHSGLGLTLVGSIATVLGGTARFGLAGREFSVTLELPAAPAGDARRGPGSGRQPVAPGAAARGA